MVADIYTKTFYIITSFSNALTMYCIAQNGGGGKLWQIGNFKNLVGKTVAYCNELSMSSSSKTCHSNTMLNLNVLLFILSSYAALKIMVRVFVVSSVVRE